MIENGKVFSRITCIFGAVEPPHNGPSETALRLRSLSEGRPPQTNFFLLIKIHNSYWKLYLCILDQISMTIMKNIKFSKYFKKIYKNNQSKIFDNNSRKKGKKKW